MREEEKLLILKHLEEGNADEAYRIIKPHLDNDDPYAMYYVSTFSLDEWNESNENFNTRSVDQLKKAASREVPEAMVHLAMLYFWGDGVEMDQTAGKKWLNGAVSLGYDRAKFLYGINLYYGSNGYEMDKDKAMGLLAEAKKNNVEGASQFLDDIGQNSTNEKHSGDPE